MMDWLTPEIIIAFFAFCGTMSGVLIGNKLTQYKIEQLQKSVEKHNNFARRMPVVEEQVKHLDARIGKLDCRLDNIENTIKRV